jgi:outer membrane PBP1 activator LpoA protein
MPLALSLLLAGAAQAQVKLAVAGPVTGANAAFGAQLTQGVQQAVEDINKAGGILGQKIQVEVGDDVSDPKQGVSVANKFVGDGVTFVVGQLRRDDAGFRRLRRKRHPVHHPLSNQSQHHGSQAVGCVPHLRPR